MKNFSISASLSTAWQMLHNNLLLILFFFIALMPSAITQGFKYFFPTLPSSFNSFDDVCYYIPTVIAPLMGIGLICNIIECLLFAGAENSALNIVNGGKASFNAFDMPISTYLKFVCAEICMSILVTIGVLFCIIPGIFIAVRLQFVPIIILDDPQCGFTDAFQRSWDMTRGNFWNLFAFFLVSILIVIIGFIFCCVGVYVAIPLIVLADIVIYKTLKSEDETTIIIEESL